MNITIDTIYEYLGSNRTTPTNLERDFIRANFTEMATFLESVKGDARLAAQMGLSKLKRSR